jgi:cell division protein ZapA (FtsZ GTPase activity inhibitor)
VQKYEIKVAGRVLVVGSDKGEMKVRRIAEYVENRMQTIASKVHTPDTARIALMTALSLAEELFEKTDHGTRALNDAV